MIIIRGFYSDFTYFLLPIQFKYFGCFTLFFKKGGLHTFKSFIPKWKLLKISFIPANTHIATDKRTNGITDIYLWSSCAIRIITEREGWFMTYSNLHELCLDVLNIAGYNLHLFMGQDIIPYINIYIMRLTKQL